MVGAGRRINSGVLKITFLASEKIYQLFLESDYLRGLGDCLLGSRVADKLRSSSNEIALSAKSCMSKFIGLAAVVMLFEEV